jgi:hypothetical protein
MLTSADVLNIDYVGPYPDSGYALLEKQGITTVRENIH